MDSQRKLRNLDWIVLSTALASLADSGADAGQALDVTPYFFVTQDGLLFGQVSRQQQEVVGPFIFRVCCADHPYERALTKTTLFKVTTV